MSPTAPPLTRAAHTTLQRLLRQHQATGYLVRHPEDPADLHVHVTLLRDGRRLAERVIDPDGWTE